MANKVSKITEYIEDVIYFKNHEDKEGLAALQREAEDHHVTLKEAGEAIMEVLDGVEELIAASQALMEIRLREVVEELDPWVQGRIKTKFTEANDGLFIVEKEENNID